MTKTASLLVLTSCLSLVYAQESGSWRDPSKRRVQFVTVDNDVRLEVLDWGGSGRPITLLAGSGNSAHVFDDFAPKLTDCTAIEFAALLSDRVGGFTAPPAFAAAIGA